MIVGPSPLGPVLAGVLLIAADLANVAYRARSHNPHWWSRFVGYLTRPLAALAIGNALCRVWPPTFPFDPRTFPLFAHPWSALGPKHPAQPGQLGRTLVACAAAALVLVLFRQTLRSGGRVTFRLAALWAAVVVAQLAIALAPMNWYGLTLPWTAPGQVYAWAAQRVDRAGGVGSFLDEYDKIQKILPIHAHSHPPGATLLSYWTQDIENPGSPGNVLRLLGMASLNMLFVYLIGRRMFNPRIATSAATLFGIMPASVAYGTFSQDTVFSLFFSLYLLLTWEVRRRERPLWPAGLAGVVLFALSMLTFSWAIAAAAAFAFVATTGFLRNEPLREMIPRLALPPALMLLLHVVAWATFDFSYYAAYREALVYHKSYYPFAGSHDWLVAFVGGQLDFLWGLGPLVAGAFLAVLAGPARRERSKPFFVYFWAILACYGVAVVFGPNPLKLETSRCWYWVAIFPVLAAAWHLDRASPTDDRPCILAAAGSLAVSLVSLAFLDFGI